MSKVVRLVRGKVMMWIQAAQHHGQWYKVTVIQYEDEFFCLTNWLRSEVKRLVPSLPESFPRSPSWYFPREWQMFLWKLTGNRWATGVSVCHWHWASWRMRVLWCWLGFEEGAVLSKLPKALKILLYPSLPNCRREHLGWEEAQKRAHLG